MSYFSLSYILGAVIMLMGVVAPVLYMMQRGKKAFLTRRDWRSVSRNGSEGVFLLFYTQKTLLVQQKKKLCTFTSWKKTRNWTQCWWRRQEQTDFQQRRVHCQWLLFNNQTAYSAKNKKRKEEGRKEKKKSHRSEKLAELKYNSQSCLNLADER